MLLFSLKCNLKAHSAPVHEGNKLIKCDLCTANFARNTDLIDIQTQFMRERSHWNVKFVPVAVTAVKWESKVRTGSWTTGSSPPRGVFTSSPQKSSPIWVNFVLMQPKDGDMKSSPRDPVPKNKCRYFILQTLKYVLYILLVYGLSN